MLMTAVAAIPTAAEIDFLFLFESCLLAAPEVAVVATNDYNFDVAVEFSVIAIQ
jgi:hypothetical protein